MKHLWVIVFSHDCHCVMVSFFSGPLPDVWCTGRCCLDLEWVQTHACHWVQTQGCTHMYIAHTHTHIHTHTHTHTGNNMTVVYLEEVPLQSLNNFKGKCTCYACLYLHVPGLLALWPSETTGHNIESFIIWNFEYGKDYSGPGYVAICLLNTVCTNHLHIASIWELVYCALIVMVTCTIYVIGCSGVAKVWLSMAEATPNPWYSWSMFPSCVCICDCRCRVSLWESALQQLIV